MKFLALDTAYTSSILLLLLLADLDQSDSTQIQEKIVSFQREFSNQGTYDPLSRSE